MKMIIKNTVDYEIVELKDQWLNSTDIFQLDHFKHDLGEQPREKRVFYAISVYMLNYPICIQTEVTIASHSFSLTTKMCPF